MEIGLDILNELKELSPTLAGMEKINVFSVPDGYFTTLNSSILNNVLNSETSVLNNISKQYKRDVPEGYFDSLADNILAKIKTQDNAVNITETEELSSLLPNIQHTNVYTVPDGYFNSTVEAILNKVLPKQAKVVTMQKRTSFVRYAVAASITVLLGLGVFTFIQKSNNPSVIVTASLDPSIEKGRNMDDKQFDESLSNLSADEIASYLENNGDETDVASLSSGIDINSLPAEDDYLTDEKTLDKYLESIDLKPTNN